MKTKAARDAIDANWSELRGHEPKARKKLPLESLIQDYFLAASEHPEPRPITLRIDLPGGSIGSDDCASIGEAVRDVTDKLIARMRRDLRNHRISQENARRALAAATREERLFSHSVDAFEAMFKTLGVPEVEPPPPKPAKPEIDEEDDLPF